MARENSQIIINYHTSGTSLPATGNVELGEVVVLHNPSKAELVIKDNNGNLHEFIDSAATNAMITTVMGDVNPTNFAAVSAKTFTNATAIAEHQTAYEALYSAVTANTSAIQTLNGTEEGSVSKKISDAMATESARTEAAYVAKVEGKGLSTNDFDNDYKGKVDGIASGAQVNVIESVKVNGSALTITDKAVDVIIPAAAEYTIAKQETAEEGMAATYYLTKDGVQVGEKINIFADQFIKNVTYISAATQADKDIDSSVVIGEPYIKFEWQLKEGGKDKITYVSIKDLIDTTYSADETTITMSEGRVFSVKDDVFAAKSHSHAHTDITDWDTELAKKVDVVEGMGLSHNDLTDDLKTAYDNAAASAHTHANKALLDTYAQTEENLADAVAKKHEHANKDLLDTYAQTEENLADAVSKKHEHANMDVLTGITAEKVTAWDAAEANVITGITVDGAAVTVTEKVAAITSFVSSVEDTTSIDLDVTSGKLTAKVLRIDGGEF